MNATTFLMADSGIAADGKPIDPLTLRSGYYSNWPAFPAEHLDADSGGVGVGGDDGAVMQTSAMAMFNSEPTSLAVTDWPAAVKITAGRGAAGPFPIIEPGAYPVSILKGSVFFFSLGEVRRSPKY